MVKIKNIAIVTSEKSWFVPFAKKLVSVLKEKGYHSKLFNKYADINKKFEVVFMLSYFEIVDKKSLGKHFHNIVVHESSLPKGRGWAPLFWQILEGKNKIPISLFEASPKLDAGHVYIKDYIILNGDELYDEIRKNQALKTIELCLRFLNNYNRLSLKKQVGKASYYKKRDTKDSQLDINKSIKEQFNLLRIVNNDEFPAFFYYKNKKYFLKIYKEN